MERLPSDLRVRIFRLAGLPEAEKVYFDPTKFWTQWPESEAIRAGLRTALTLSLVCRTISNDALLSFYRDNIFVLRATRSEDLDVIRRFRPRTIQALTQLIIHLNTTSCILPDQFLLYSEWVDSTHKMRNGRSVRETNSGLPLVPLQDPLPSPMSLLDPGQKVFLSHWVEVMSAFVLHSSHSLDLGISCDCDNTEVACQVVKPLRKLKTAVKNCDLRLARSPDDSAMKQLAREAAFTAMNVQQHVAQRISFSDLPYEIQTQILSHTDLIMPSRQVQWSPRSGFRINRAQYCGGHFSGDAGPAHKPCRIRECLRNSLGACFCQRYHASWSRKCECWVPPTALFLASRGFKAAAESVFYSENHFVVAPISGYEEAKTIESGQSFVENFFKNVVGSRAMQGFASLAVTFPAVRCSSVEQPWLDSWYRAVDYLKTHASPARLTLNLDLKSMSAFSGKRYERAHEDERKQIRAFHENLLHPLKRLGPFRAFFLDLPQCILDRPLSKPLLRDWYKRALTTLEQQVEMEVQGVRYDATIAEKAFRSQPHWENWESLDAALGSGLPSYFMPEWWALDGDSITEEEYFTKLGPFNRARDRIT